MMLKDLTYQQWANTGNDFTIATRFLTAQLGNATEIDAYYDDLVPVYAGLGILSLAAASLVAFVFLRSPSIHRDHSSKLILIITVCDFLYTLKYTVAALAYAAGFTDPTLSMHIFNDSCLTSEIWGQFFSMACISWNACWIFDFMCVLRDPLRNTEHQMRWYHLFAWSLSLLTTVYIAIVSVRDAKENQSCWTFGDTTTDLIFSIPLIIFLFLGVVSIIMAFRRLYWGQDVGTRFRRALFQRHALYVAVFIVVWVWPEIHAHMDRNNTNLGFTVVDAICVSAQALVFAIIRLSQPGARNLIRSAAQSSAVKLADSVDHLCPGCRRCGGGDSVFFIASLFCFCGCTCKYHRMPTRRGASQSSGGYQSLNEHPFNGARSVDGEDGVRINMPLVGRVEHHTPPLPSPQSSISSTYRNPVLENFRHAELDSGRHGLNVSISTSTLRLSKARPSSQFDGSPQTPQRQISAQSNASRIPDMALGMALEGSMSSPLIVNDATQEPPAISVILPDSRAGLVQPRPTQDQSIASSVSTPLLAAVDGDASRSVSSFDPARAQAVDQYGNPEFDVASMTNPTALLPAETSTAPLPIGQPIPAAALRPKAGWDALYGLRMEEAFCMLSGVCQAILCREVTREKGLDGADPSLPLNANLKDIDSLLTDASTRAYDMPLIQQIDCDDYMENEKKNFPSMNPGSSCVKKLPDRTGTRFEIASLADRAFAALRDAAALKAGHIAYSLDPYLLISGQLSAHFSQGASSSFFCRSVDQLLVVKTVGEPEVRELLKLLPAYREHLVKYPNSLLCRLYGCFSLKLRRSARAYFLLMGNVFPIVEPGNDCRIFDLKGSTVGRRARVSKSVTTKSKDGKQVSQGLLYQDMEFREQFACIIPCAAAQASAPPDAALTDADLNVGVERAAHIVAQLRADVELLVRHELMDYSLLVSVTPIDASMPCTDVENISQLAFTPSDDSATSAAYRLSFQKAAQVTLSDCLALSRASSALSLQLASSVTPAGGGAAITRWSPLAVSLCVAKHAPPDLSRKMKSPDPTGQSSSTTIPLYNAEASTQPYQRVLIQLGVIDMLQAYNAGKKMENTIKSIQHAVTHAKLEPDISSVAPGLYASRFMAFVESIFSPPSEASRELSGVPEASVIP